MVDRKVPVSRRALVSRINRRLAHENERLCRARGQRLQNEFGEYYILDLHRNNLCASHITLDKLAQELGVLRPWEILATEED